MSWRVNVAVPLRLQLLYECEVYVELLNGFLLWIAEIEVLGFKVNEP